MQQSQIRRYSFCLLAGFGPIGKEKAGLRNIGTSDGIFLYKVQLAPKKQPGSPSDLGALSGSMALIVFRTSCLDRTYKNVSWEGPGASFFLQVNKHQT